MSTATREAARRYIGRGWVPIPIPPNSKNPNRTGWESESWAVEDVDEAWNNGQNIGLLTGQPSGWLVDVDLDCPEAAALAGRFLPTTLTSGREGSPDSHWWHVSEGTENGEWKDIDGRKKLIELRGTGRQTLVEPSEHPSGGRYSWSRSGLDIAAVDAAELRARCTELATAVLVARHLPEHRDAGGGGRHDYAMALAGFLLRPGRLDEDLTLKILVAAWDAKGWPNEGLKRETHRDLEGVVRDTAQDLADGEPVVGGPTLEEMVPGMVRLLRRYWGWRREEQAPDAPAEDKEDRRNQADRLIGYALEDLGDGALFADQHGAPHALVVGEPVPLNSRCYSWLRRLMWEQEGKAVNGEYLKTAAGTLAAHAEFSGDARELHTRAAWHEGTLYYELRPGSVVWCGAGGWGFAENPPVLFRRYPNLKPLPDPEPGGSLDAIDELVNIKRDEGRRLFKAYLATVALPHVGRPILNVAGAMGSGKTTIGRLVKRTWDPTAPETVRYDPRDFLQKASHAFVVMLDNLSALPEPAADTACRLVTGEADSKRRLYSDDEDVIIELKRAVLLNGINVPTDRGDVLDRSLVVELERIPDGERRTEEELWERFEAEHPELLGTLFSVLSEAIAVKPSLQLSRRPRLADWGEYAAAIYAEMGWGAETFLEDWDEVVKSQNQATLDGSPVAQVIIKLVKAEGEFVGTASELHNELKPVAEKLGVDRDKAWPKSARWVWRRIKEVLPVLSAAGIEASREHSESGTVIALRETPTDDVSDVRTGESRVGKPKTPDNKGESNASSNVRSESNVSSNVRENPAYLSASDNTDNTDIRFGDFSESPLSDGLKPGDSATLGELEARREGGEDHSQPDSALADFFQRPPSWYIKQANHCASEGAPDRLLKPLASSVAYEVFGSAARWQEVLAHIKSAMKERKPRP